MCDQLGDTLQTISRRTMTPQVSWMMLNKTWENYVLLFFLPPTTGCLVSYWKGLIENKDLLILILYILVILHESLQIRLRHIFVENSQQAFIAIQKNTYSQGSALEMYGRSAHSTVLSEEMWPSTVHQPLVSRLFDRDPYDI